MSPVRRVWVGLAAIGAGLIHFAVATTATPVLAIAFSIIGAVAFGWGVLVLFDERFVAARIAVFAALAPIAVWVVAIIAGLGAALHVLPLGIAAICEVIASIVLAVHVRTPTTTDTRTTSTVVGYASAALVIGVLTVLALVASASATQIVPGDFFGPHVH
jgi:hypothetical protein